MSIFNFFRRLERADDGVQQGAEPSREDIEPQVRAGLDDASGRAQEPPALEPEVIELRARAAELQERITQAMQRENTPANFAGYDEVDEDVMLSDVWPGPASAELENDLDLLILSRPEAFDGTEFEVSERELAEMRSGLLEPDHEEDQVESDEFDQPSL